MKSKEKQLNSGHSPLNTIILNNTDVFGEVACNKNIRFICDNFFGELIAI